MWLACENVAVFFFSCWVKGSEGGRDGFRLCVVRGTSLGYWLNVRKTDRLSYVRVLDMR
jgi:hypothetical protein